MEGLLNEGESGMGLVGSLFLLRDLGLQLGDPRFELRDARWLQGSRWRAGRCQARWRAAACRSRKASMSAAAAPSGEW